MREYEGCGVCVSALMREGQGSRLTCSHGDPFIMDPL